MKRWKCPKCLNCYETPEDPERCLGCGWTFNYGELAAPDRQPCFLPGFQSEPRPKRPSVPAEDQRLTTLRVTREKVYGDAKGNHTSTGLLWTAILQYHYRIKLEHPIPPHIVCLLLAAMKIERAAAPYEFHQDNFDDAINYVRMAAEVDSRNPSKEIRNESSSNRG